jgi:hypothetical protein
VPVRHGHALVPTMQCRFCGSSGPHFPIAKVSPVGWVVFGVLVFAFLPLCWVGLLIKSRGVQCGSCRQWIVPPT